MTKPFQNKLKVTNAITNFFQIRRGGEARRIISQRWVGGATPLKNPKPSCKSAPTFIPHELTRPKLIKNRNERSHLLRLLRQEIERIFDVFGPRRLAVTEIPSRRTSL